MRPILPTIIPAPSQDEKLNNPIKASIPLLTSLGPFTRRIKRARASQSGVEREGRKKEVETKMVKVLENKIIDLDLLPGQAQIDLQRQFRQQLDGAKTVTAGQLAQATNREGDGTEGEEEGEGLKKGQVQIPREMLPDSMDEEEKERARGIAGTIVDGSGRVVGGLAGTVGGVLKGVGDTGANVVSLVSFITAILKVRWQLWWWKVSELGLETLETLESRLLCRWSSMFLLIVPWALGE